MSKKHLEFASKYATHPVAVLLLPMAIKAMDDREAAERKDIEALRVELEAAGMDANIVAPYPRDTYGKDYFAKKSKYDFLNNVVTTVSSRGRFDPRIVAMDPKAIESYIRRCRHEAGFEFEAFVYKLCGKVGTVETAKLDAEYAQGWQLWNRSTLTVTKADGTTERWFTQCIVNRSINGKLFNQFPTRKRK
jgi:hypothetical protein